MSRSPSTLRAARVGIAAHAVAVLTLLLVLLLAPAVARAQTLSVVQTSDSSLTLDSNKPASSGPQAAYVSFRITNTGATTASNLGATLGGLSGGIALGGGQQATQYIGSLAPGQYATLFWYISYPPTFGIRDVLTVAVTSGATQVATGTGVDVTYSMISAQAGGLTSTSTIGPGAVVGQLIPLDVTFTFKGWLVGDRITIQPSGSPSFPAGCFQMVKDSIESADYNLNSVIVPGTVNQITFYAGVQSTGGQSAQWNVVVRYWFKYLCSGTSATPLPYSNELSGTQLKYSANYGSGGGAPTTPIPAAPAPTANFTFAKSAATPQLPSGGAETYTVTIRNTSTFDVTVDSIMDVLPSGATYQGLASGSGVTATNSASVPSVGATGTVVFHGQPGTSYAIAAGGTLNLVYNVTLPATAGQYVNNAGAYVGTTAIGTGTSTVTVGTADVTVSKAGPTGAALSDTLRYAITVANAGPQAAYQVVAVDSLPGGVTFLRTTNGGTLANGVVTWPAVASIASGASVVDSVIVLAPSTATSIVNVARASAASYDPTPTNNNGSATTNQVGTAVSYAVSVTPKGTGSAARQLPGTRYAETFTVTNNSVAAGTYSLLAGITGTTRFITIDSLTGPGITTRTRPDSSQVTLAARSSTGYTVWYTIPVAADTSVDVEGLRARNVAQTAITDTGYVQIQRAYPTLTLHKTVSPTGVVTPGADLTYSLSFANQGTFGATQVVVWDNVPTAVSFRLGSPAQSLPGGVTAAVSYSSDGGATWTYTPVSGGCGAAAGYDSCVTRVRWSLSGTLSPSVSSSSVSFVARVR